MEYKRSGMSECELVTMKCIWDEGGSATCPQVIKDLKENYGMDYKVTTVYTFLSKLVEKGFVEQEKDKLTQYKALYSEKEYFAEWAKKNTEFWFANSIPSFVSALVHMKKLNKKEREELKKIMEDLHL